MSNTDAYDTFSLWKKHINLSFVYKEMELEMSVMQSQDKNGNPNASNGKALHVTGNLID